VFAHAASLLKSRRLSQVSCLIADMRMPKMTGLELHQHLVALNRAIPTILMTAYPGRAGAGASNQSQRGLLSHKTVRCGRIARLRAPRRQRHDVGGE